MSFKNWPSWLKGGVISILSALIISIITGIYASLVNGFFEFFNFNFFILPLVLPLLGMNPPEELLGIILLGIFVGSVLLWFLIGALIGWIVGKIKKR